MKKPFSIVAIVVTHNGISYIRNCLDNLVRAIGTGEILVIDNGSSDGTVTIVEEEYPQVTVIQLAANYGFGRANNVGLRIALDRDAHHILLVNQDVYVEADTIDKLIGVATAHPGYGILSPMHLNGKGNALDAHFAGYVSSVLLSDLYVGTLRPVYDCPFVNAAAWLVSRQCIEKVGGFDPLFFHYGEDRDFVKRARYFNLKTGVCPRIRIRHDRGPRNAMATYPAARKRFIEVLGKLKDINTAFYKIAGSIFLHSIYEMTASLLCLQFKTFGTAVKVFFLVWMRLNRIIVSRKKSRRGGAFLDDSKQPPRPAIEKIKKGSVPHT